MESMIPVSFAKAPASLGGISGGGGGDLVASRSSFYRRLPRMKSLLPLPVPSRVYKRKKLCQMYEKLSRGDFFAKCVTSDGDVETPAVIMVRVPIDSGERTKDERFSIVFYEDNAPRTNVMETRHHSSSALIQRLTAVLSEEEVPRLYFRILHHYVRSSGCRLSWSDLKQLQDISNTVLRQQSGLEALDIAMSVADIGINNAANDTFIVRALCNVSSALRELGRDADAALVYEEAAEDFCEFEVHETEIAKLYLISAAGCAWSCDKNFKRAEEAHIKVLNISSRHNVDLSDERIQNIFQNLLGVYQGWSDSGETEQQQASGEISDVKCILATLFAMAGYRLDPQLISLLKPAMIQDNLKEGKQAQLALDRARKSSTPRCFRDVVLSCANNPKDSHSQSKGKVKKTHTNTSRHETTSQAKGAEAEPVKCSNPNCKATGVEIMQCLCRGAHYCDRRCQKAHWQDHKRTCTYYLDRKGSKK